jgi:uncharacterized membrane protein
MSDLIAIGYPDEATAEAAADEARRLARDLIIEPDAIWGLLFGLLFFVPVAGIAIGAGLGALMGKISKSGIDAQELQDALHGGSAA